MWYLVLASFTYTLLKVYPYYSMDQYTIPFYGWIIYHCIDILHLFFVNVYSFLRDRERQSVSGGGAEKEGTQDLKQALGYEPSAQSLIQGSNPQTVRS